MNRTGLLIVALFVVLLVAWLSGVFDTEFSTVNVPEWEIDRDAIDELSLRSPTDTVVLSRAGDVWRLTRPIDATVDSAKLTRLLDDLEDLGFGSVVSTNVDRHGRFGVDSTGASIVVRSGRKEETLVVGNPGADFETVYVRIGGDDRVFGSRGRVAVDAAVDSWRDRTIVSVPRSAVVRVSVEGPGGSYKVSRESGPWTIEEGGETVAADSSAVDRWLRRFAPLKGNRFATAQAFAGAAPFARVTIETIGGSTAGVELKEGEAELLARGPVSDAVLTVSEGMKSSLVPESGSLRAVR